jgi:4-amino-4-deoxy-L-arabinose transferase-like glycosyltransferase
MVLRGDPVNACFAAQLVNFGLGALAVAAIWKAARPWGGPAAMFAALLAASCPFMTYLCGLAYVENGLLLFTGLALAVLTANKGGESKPALAAGLFAGFACGCKYIAVPQVALPIGAAILWQGRRTPRQAARQITLYCVGVIVTFSPWLIKNAVFTGNPVFPLARSIFHERTGIWDDDGAARWQEGHLPGPEDRTPARRLGRLVGEVIVHDLYGISIAAGLIALVLSALLRSRFGSEGLLAPMIWLIAVSMIVWLFFTHLVDRFAIVLVPPCCVLAGVAAVGVSGRGVALGRVIIGAFVVVNGFLLVRICNESGIFRLSGARIDDGLELFLGSEDNPAGLWPTHEHVPRVNELAAGGRKVLMVGDARRFYLNRGVDYCVIFNRNPFAEVVADKTPTEVVEWLKSKGYSYVFVNWSEMRRLSKSRYGFWAPLLDDATWLRLSGVLKREKDYISGQRNGLYATLFRVP